MQGRIKFWNADRFFGFIESGQESYFFHGKNVIGGADNIQVGDVVQFELGSNARGPAAVSVELVERAAVGG